MCLTDGGDRQGHGRHRGRFNCDKLPVSLSNVGSSMMHAIGISYFIWEKYGCGYLRLKSRESHLPETQLHIY